MTTPPFDLDTPIYSIREHRALVRKAVEETVRVMTDEHALAMALARNDVGRLSQQQEAEEAARRISEAARRDDERIERERALRSEPHVPLDEPTEELPPVRLTSDDDDASAMMARVLRGR